MWTASHLCDTQARNTKNYTTDKKNKQRLSRLKRHNFATTPRQSRGFVLQ